MSCPFKKKKKKVNNCNRKHVPCLKMTIYVVLRCYSSFLILRHIIKVVALMNYASHEAGVVARFVDYGVKTSLHEGHLN